MISIYAEQGKQLRIGLKGENNARQVVFDISQWRSAYGPGTVQLLVQRTGEITPYPAAMTVDGNRVLWMVTAADTDIPGSMGKAELRYLVNDTLAKSETWTTIVLDALGEPSETPPEPQKWWVDQVLAAGADVQNRATQAIQAIQTEGNTQAERVAAEGAKQTAAAKAEADRAKTAEGNAEDSAKKSAESEDKALSSAKLSESYAVGGTGEREGEDTNNSKYWAGESAASAKVSQEGAERVETAAIRQPYPNPETGTWWAWDVEAGAYKDTGETYNGNVMYATFDIDPATGELHMITPDGYMGPQFAINEDGYLEVSINA